MTEGLECPTCHKNGLVRCPHDTDDVYQCVYCNHVCDLTKAREKEKEEPTTIDINTLVAAVIIVGIITLALVTGI